MGLSTHMTNADNDKAPEHWTAYNYLISFIDLLGQRDALQGQGLLPVFKTEEDHKRFTGTLKDSIGAILKLQARAEDMLRDAPVTSATLPASSLDDAVAMQISP